MKILLEYKANVNATDTRGQTALFVANASTAAVLIANGIHEKQRNVYGKIAEQVNFKLAKREKNENN